MVGNTYAEFRKKSDLDGLVKSPNSRRANFVIMRRTFRTLNDYEMQHNAEVGLFTRPSKIFSRPQRSLKPVMHINFFVNVVRVDLNGMYTYKELISDNLTGVS